MKTETYKDGTVTHNYSDDAIAIASKELLGFLKKHPGSRPGDLEDEFTGQWSIDLGPWRGTPHFPALARLVDAGKVDWGRKPNGDVCYALAGNLPKSVKHE